MKITFDETSDYGQDVLELLGELSELMDPEKEFAKKDLRLILRRIQAKTYHIEAQVVRTGTGYFEGAKE